MKNKHIMIIGISVLILSFVLGITKTIDLAPLQTTQNKSGDKLIGAMITKESLHLFDFESYFNDHAKDIVNGNHVVSGTDGYTNRIYAELVETTAVNEETGETVYTKEYIFPDTDGWYLYCATVYDEPDNYVTNIAGEGLSEVKSGNHYKDNGEERTMEATLYTTHGSDLYTVYINPIYQTADGEVYITEGTGIGGAGGLTKTLTETVTIEKDGEEFSYTATIIIHREAIDTPQSVILTQMDADHTPLQTDLFPAGTLPQTFFPTNGTAYILVTEQNLDENGKMIENRFLVQPTDAYLETFTATENGVCEKMQTEIRWLNAEDAM